MRPIPSTARNAVFLAGIAILSGALTAPALADIYRWVDESGGLHFTDDLSSIPEKHRGKVQDILKTPPPAGKPGLSTIGGYRSPPASGTTVPASPGDGDGGASSAPPALESPESVAEQLRAKIAAKEQFIERVDVKRSNILNPLGNRFISPEDLELYGKYSAELPGDRERLREIEAGLPPGVN